MMHRHRLCVDAAHRKGGHGDGQGGTVTAVTAGEGEMSQRGLAHVSGMTGGVQGGDGVMDASLLCSLNAPDCHASLAPGGPMMNGTDVEGGEVRGQCMTENDVGTHDVGSNVMHNASDGSTLIVLDADSSTQKLVGVVETCRNETSRNEACRNVNPNQHTSSNTLRKLESNVESDGAGGGRNKTATRHCLQDWHEALLRLLAVPACVLMVIALFAPGMCGV